MRSKIVLLFLLGIIVSGCIQNPLKQVPVMKVNITLSEYQGYVVPDNVTFTQGYVDYAARPISTVASSFPAIAARIMVTRNNTNTTLEGLGPWETLTYSGSGTYLFNIGFDEKYYPERGDILHISIMVVDEKGKRIGYVVVDRLWE